jgi:hypothetical protein
LKKLTDYRKAINEINVPTNQPKRLPTPELFNRKQHNTQTNSTTKLISQQTQPQTTATNTQQDVISILRDNTHSNSQNFKNFQQKLNSIQNKMNKSK